MKKILLAALVLVSMSASAQVRLNLYGNYIFDDQIDSYYDANNYYNGRIKGGFQWGAGLEYMVRPMYGIELMYNREDATAFMKNYKYPKGADYKLGINYIFLNGTRHFVKPSGKVEGFAGGGLGMAIIDAKGPNASDGSVTHTKFAWQFRGGAIIWASEAIGIRLQAQLQSAVQAVGGGLYFGTGGAGVGATSYSSLLQFGLGGGLVFKFHGAATKK